MRFLPTLPEGNYLRGNNLRSVCLWNTNTLCISTNRASLTLIIRPRETRTCRLSVLAISSSAQIHWWARKYVTQALFGTRMLRYTHTILPFLFFSPDSCCAHTDAADFYYDWWMYQSWGNNGGQMCLKSGDCSPINSPLGSLRYWASGSISNLGVLVAFRLLDIGIIALYLL